VKTKNPVPAYVPTTRTPRSWTHSKNAAGYFILQRLARVQRRPSWPAGSGDTTGLQHPADANRLWHSQLNYAWKNTIGATERAAYEAAAATFSLLNNKGQHKTPNGFQLFVWWNSYTAGDTWGPPYPWVFYPDFWDDVPPQSTWPKPTPYQITLVDSTPPYFTINYKCDSDLTNYYAFLQLTNAAKPGGKTPTSHWQRLGPVQIYSTYPNYFTPGYTIATPVPPWTAAPGYNAANWNVHAGVLSFLGTPVNQSIRAGASLQTYSITANIGLAVLSLNVPMLTWGINPSTGARLALLCTHYDPTTHVIYADGHSRFFLVSFTSWSSAFTLLTAGLAWTTTDANVHSYTVTRDYTTDTVATPAGTITYNNGGSLPTTDAGIDASFSIYSLTYYALGGPLHWWTTTANYQAIIENPANHGPRGLRLTLGANYEVGTLHSDWAETSISL
jgi:hypothetical protein